MSRRKIEIYKIMLIAALFVLTLISGGNVAHAALGLDFDASANPLINSNGGPGTFGASSGYTIVGWSFTPTVDLYLNRLGVYDADIDRMHTELHQVGIWNASDQSLIESVNIGEYSNTPEISPHGAYFHFADAGNILLKANQTYYVGATLFTGPPTVVGNSGNASDFDTFAWIGGPVQTTVTENPYITYGGSAYAINTAGNQLVFPGLTTGPTDYTIGANIDVTPTPIPAAAWLLGSGLMGLVGIRRRTGQ
jgi:hypothetical protein